MGLANEIADLIQQVIDGLLPASAAWNTSDATGNVLLFPRITPSSLTVKPGALPDPPKTGDTILSRRADDYVYATAGPGATLSGIGAMLQPLLARITPAPATPLTAVQIAQALLVFNQYFLDMPALTQWQVGRTLVLPVLSSAWNVWLVDVTALGQLAARFDHSRDALLNLTPALLALPDAANIDSRCTALVQNNINGQTSADAVTHTQQSAMGLDLARQVLANPFESVFFGFEAFRRTPAIGSFFAHHLCALSARVPDFLAGITAGNALLRQAFSLITDSASADLAPMSEALGLGAGGAQTIPWEVTQTAMQGIATGAPGTATGSIHERGGGVPDMPGDQAAEPSGGAHRLVLGRELCAGHFDYVVISGTKYIGPAYGGRIGPQRFLDNNQSLLNPDNNPTFKARLTLVARLAITEAFLDGVRLRDGGILSTGMQQWTCSADNELSLLHFRFLQMAPEEYMLHFGIYGLGVKLTVPVTAARNPECTFLKSQPQGNLTPNGQMATLARSERMAFFGGTVNGTVCTFTSDWAALSRAACLFSEKFKVAQLLQASSRFDRVQRDVQTLQYGAASGTIPVALSDAITSEYGAALVLDSHINQPAAVQSVLQTAIRNNSGHGANQLAAADSAADRKSKLAALEPAIVAAFRTARQTYDTPGRNGLIDAHVHPKFDPAPGSFGAGWGDMSSGIGDLETIFQ